MKKTFVIGDIHGGLRALRQVLERVGLDVEDRLIFLGDYVDGWSESREVIDYLIELDRSHACTFVIGNHDVWCMEWLARLGGEEEWLGQGGQATVDSYAGAEEELKMRHLMFFSQMIPYYEDEHRRLFVHAGFTSIHGPAREYFSSNFYWDRTLWEMALVADSRIPLSSLFYPKRLRLYDEIFIGHTPTTNYDIDTPMNKCNVWNIDTGAAFTGRITVMDVSTKRYWQSDIVQDLYPGEVGRNKL
ncbi:MAG TPA: metallophosphoesterase family protein [Puia sp.]|jgi:serine/threonine protein phosphatase 1|nr:metallophosphoesterase family protein [Puia sp.]